MVIKAILGGSFDTVGYLLYDRDGGCGAIIDAPVLTSKRFVDAINQHKINLLYIINTHGHWDQTADNASLVNTTGATLCVHPWDMTRLAHPELTYIEKPPFPLSPSAAERYLHDDETIEVGDIKLQVLHTPGHSPGSVCLLASAANALFTGDTLRRGGVGRADLPGGNAEQLTRSLLRLASLPDRTTLFPARGPATTLREERWLLDLAALEEAPC